MKGKLDQFDEVQRLGRICIGEGIGSSTGIVVDVKQGWASLNIRDPISGKCALVKQRPAVLKVIN